MAVPTALMGLAMHRIPAPMKGITNMSNAWAAQIDEEGYTVYTTKSCMVCHNDGHLALPTAGYRAWRDGALVQDAFPDMPLDRREQLISGTHPLCWTLMFCGEED